MLSCWISWWGSREPRPSDPSPSSDYLILDEGCSTPIFWATCPASLPEDLWHSTGYKHVLSVLCSTSSTFLLFFLSVFFREWWAMWDHWHCPSLFLNPGGFLSLFPSRVFISHVQRRVACSLLSAQGQTAFPKECSWSYKWRGRDPTLAVDSDCGANCRM